MNEEEKKNSNNIEERRHSPTLMLSMKQSLLTQRKIPQARTRVSMCFCTESPRIRDRG